MKHLLLLILLSLAGVSPPASAAEFILLPAEHGKSTKSNLRIARVLLMPPLGRLDIEGQIQGAVKAKCEGYDGASVFHVSAAGDVGRTVVVISFQCFR